MDTFLCIVVPILFILSISALQWSINLDAGIFRRQNW